MRGLQEEDVKLAVLQNGYWIIPKRSELVRSLILNYSTFFLELVLYWLILNIDSLLMWQFLSLFRSIKCWIILSNKKKFENRNKDGILQSVHLEAVRLWLLSLSWLMSHQNDQSDNNAWYLTWECHIYGKN